MIYLVTNQTTFVDFEAYTIITPEESIQRIRDNKSKYIEYDCETGCNKKDSHSHSLDPHTGYLLSMQFGLDNDQIVVDCTSVNPLIYKDIFEDKELTFVGWNLNFDCQWLLVKGIVPENVYDAMIIEQLMHLGEDHVKNQIYKCSDPIISPQYDKTWTEEELQMYKFALDHKFALKTAVWKYLHINMDKTVRGSINTEGLTTRVIQYAAGDVTYLNKIRLLQEQTLKEENLLKAAKFENKCVVPLAYLTLCGAKMDTQKWLTRAQEDKPKLDNLVATIKQDILDWYNENKAETKKGIPHVYQTYLIEGSSQVKREMAICREHDIPIDAERYQEIFEDKIIYKWPVPFGFYSGRGKARRFIPYVYRDMEGDLFSGFNTELQINPEINIGSSDQLIPLFTMMGMKCTTIDKKTHEEKASLGKEVINLYKDTYKIAKDLSNYKELRKLLDSFGPAFLTNINFKTQRLHASWHQLGTRTGRLSSSNPNLQQMPSDAYTRSCFIAEKGNKWISADYMSQESRLIASISKDKECIKLFNEGCGDSISVCHPKW